LLLAKHDSFLVDDLHMLVVHPWGQTNVKNFSSSAKTSFRPKKAGQTELVKLQTRVLKHRQITKRKYIVNWFYVMP
jgi:hypothetical protein